jgi:ubiquitin-like protein Pup
MYGDFGEIMTQSDFLHPKKTVNSIDDSTPNSSAQHTVVDFSDLLDQIDSVLEKNAEEFVNNFVQKGGE